MDVTDEERRRRIEDCRGLYLKYGGGNHELIEWEMRELGHTDFHRRSMYRRFERGRCREGWINLFGWEGLVRRAATFYSPAGCQRSISRRKAA
jgi:hypothetical protein